LPTRASEVLEMNPPQEQATLSGSPTTGTAPTIKIYDGGRWVDSSAKTTGEVRNPADNTLLARVPMGGAADVDRAVKAALAAYPAWRTTPPVGRVKYLFQLKQVMEREAEELA